ncbi:MAG: prolyl oligopeptidase family serine peptidase [Polyangiaceae bacterium]|nr:prolyl oligopeptidase family serine peptidase [Polyangiaceae bacterium]
MGRYRDRFLAGVSILVGLLAAVPAGAASLQKIAQSEWWAGVSGLPSYVNMYLYVPDTPASKPPIVVVPHHCQGDGTSSYNESKSLVSLADRNGFIMIFPEATGQNCWDAGSDRSLNHDGKGDAPAIVQMVRYVLSQYSADAGRVYSVGGSSGGIMTEALLGVFPDVFMAGVSLMGVPCGCWAEDYNDVVGKPSNGTGQWSGPCAGGSVDKTAGEWGDLVRSYFPGYAGHRPRLQHWHGTSDTTLSYKNVAQDIREWTNLLGLDEKEDGSDTPKSGTTRQYWKSACGYTVFEVFSLSGVGHAVPFDGNAVAAYFGLDQAGGQDPETAACPDAVPGGATSGTGGTSGSGGTSATGGDGGATGGDGGTSGAGGGEATGGGPAGGRTGGRGGVGGRSSAGSGGSLETGGTVETGGVAGGTSATGGDVTIGGRSSMAAGGTTATGGISATGGMVAVGGNVATGGSPAQVGGGVGAGAAPASGPGSSGASGTESDTGSEGCGCRLGHHAEGSATATALLVAALGIVLRRRQRRAR